MARSYSNIQTHRKRKAFKHVSRLPLFYWIFYHKANKFQSSFRRFQPEAFSATMNKLVDMINLVKNQNLVVVLYDSKEGTNKTNMAIC